MKKIIRLTESDLHRIIKESVKRILREEDFSSMGGGDIGGGDSVGDMGGGDIGPIEDGVDEESPIAGTPNAAQSGEVVKGSGFKHNRDFFGSSLERNDPLCKFKRR